MLLRLFIISNLILIVLLWVTSPLVVAQPKEIEQTQKTHQQLTYNDPANPKLFLRMGNMFLQERPHEAAIAYQIAYYLGEPSTVLPVRIAEIYFQLQDIEQAVTWYDRAALLHAADRESYQLRQAQMLFSVQSYQSASKIASGLTASNNKECQAQAHLLLGQISMQQMDYGEAVRHWQKAVNVEAENTEKHAAIADPVYLFLGSYYFQQKNYEAAAQNFELWLDSGSIQQQALGHLIASHIHNTNFDKAREYLCLYIEEYGLTDKTRRLIRLLLSVK